VTRLILHQLKGTKRAGRLAELVERIYKTRRPLIIWVADEGRLQILDDFLWTYNKLAFVPHAVWSPAVGELDEPVVITSQPANPNASEVLVVGDGLPPDDWAAGFGEVHDLIPPGDEGDRRRAFWDRWGKHNGAEVESG
jgi:DNA polymerase-3 subunit chi